MKLDQSSATNESARLAARAVVGAPLFLSGMYEARGSATTAAARPVMKRRLVAAGCRNNNQAR